MSEAEVSLRNEKIKIDDFQDKVMAASRKVRPLYTSHALTCTVLIAHAVLCVVFFSAGGVRLNSARRVPGILLQYVNLSLSSNLNYASQEVHD